MRLFKNFSLRSLLLWGILLSIFFALFYQYYHYHQNFKIIHYQRLRLIQNALKTSSKNYTLEELSSCTNLKLFSNNASVIIPHLQELYSLKQLDLSNCFVKNLSFLENIPNLLSLKLGNDREISELEFRHFEKLKSLTSLNLYDTTIGDEVLQFIIESCPKITKLCLAQTNVSDKGLFYLKKLKSLNVLDLMGTGITDSALESISSFQELYALNLITETRNEFFRLPLGTKKTPNMLEEGPSINADHLSILASLPNLTVLLISYISKESILQLKIIKNLKILCLNNYFSGNTDKYWLHELSLLEKLQELYFVVGSVEKTDWIVQILERIKTLKKLHIRYENRGSFSYELRQELLKIQRKYYHCEIIIQECSESPLIPQALFEIFGF